jgi:hypothetical protein
MGWISSPWLAPERVMAREWRRALIVRRME